MKLIQRTLGAQINSQVATVFDALDDAGAAVDVSAYKAKLVVASPAKDASGILTNAVAVLTLTEADMTMDAGGTVTVPITNAQASNLASFSGPLQFELIVAASNMSTATQRRMIAKGGVQLGLSLSDPT